MEKKFDRNVLSSVHINFLFGAGVNGNAFPQLKSFNNTLAKIEELGGNIENGLEFGIDSLNSSDDISLRSKQFYMIYHKMFQQLQIPNPFDTNRLVLSYIFFHDFLVVQ